MTIEEKVRKPHMKRLIIWIILILTVSTIAICYHTLTDTQFAPAASAAGIIFIAAWTFYLFGLWDYFNDKSFAGKVIHCKEECRMYKISAFERRIETRLFVTMTVECDDGTTTVHEEMLSSALSKKIPYREGDRVYHIKGAKYTCRFPRNDTEKKYEPISVICPLCGAVNTLGTKTCTFCENDLSYDPLIK
jgi:hypothetical protein